MLSFNEFAAFLEGSVARIEPGLVENTEVLMEAVVADARAMFGTYQPGWAPLAASTLADKTAKGFSPPDNPRLRTGEDRDSVHAEVEADLFGVTGIVGSERKINMWQELGTARIPPRPVLGPAMVKVYPVAEFLFGNFAMSLLTPGAAR